jgi:hypothetical protein
MSVKTVAKNEHWLEVSQEKIEELVLHILMNAETGKGTRPKKLTAYQIATQLPTYLVESFVEARQFGGRGVRLRGVVQPLTMRVANACKALARKGLVSIDYLDTHLLRIEVLPGVFVEPSFEVCGLYQYIGDLDDSDE